VADDRELARACQETLEARFLSSLTQIDAPSWNRIAGTGYPFLRHEFLAALEQTGCTDAESGWQPCHVTLYRGNVLVALMPLYLKSHSYGEYVFDWSWADAWHRHGRDYYPKLLTAIPFTPATGPRLCVAGDEDESSCRSAIFAAVRELAVERGLSSWHVLFPTSAETEQLERLGTSTRAGTQFHWFNRGYGSFEEFLGEFNSRKRKSLKRERRRVREQGVALEVLDGREIGEADWQEFYHFYQMTYAKRSGHGGYLTREFFLQVGETLAEHCVMVRASLDGAAVAGSLCFRSEDTLYGRYWGCARELDCLHFEACYYQGIEYCIERGLSSFDPGAQGEHKIQRGFTPTATTSCHWIADPAFAQAIEDFTRREQRQSEAYRESASDYLPFRRPGSTGS
jgi:predicted N-acyltransferase